MARSDRPLSRSIIKLAMTLLRGRNHAHAHNAWPFLRLEVPRGPEETGRIVYRGEVRGSLRSFSCLKAASGSKIYIIGSGPSVTENRLDNIEPGTAILLNGAITLIGSPIEHPLAVAIEDERFVWRHFKLMQEKIGGETLCLFSVGVIRAICELDAQWLQARSIILIDDIRKPYGGLRRRHNALKKLPYVLLSTDGGAGFSSEPWGGVFHGGSVAVTAVQFAAACQPQEIGLFGIDISNAASPRFYEVAGDTAKSGIAGAENRIVAHFALAKAACDERGIVMENFSKTSALQRCGITYNGRFAKR